MQSGPSSEQPKVLHIGGITLHHVFQAHPKWMSCNIFPFLAGASNTVQIQACVFLPLSKWSLLVPSVAISFLFNGMHYSIISINNGAHVSTVWFGWPSNIHFMRSSSACVITLCPSIRWWVSTSTRQQVRSCFSKGEWLLALESMPLLQNPRTLHSNSLIGTYQRFHIISISATILQMPFSRILKSEQGAIRLPCWENAFQEYSKQKEV